MKIAIAIQILLCTYQRENSLNWPYRLNNGNAVNHPNLNIPVSD